MHKLHIPLDLWTAVLDALEERIEQADYLAPEEYDDAEHEESCKRTAEAARETLKQARGGVDLPDLSEEAEARRAAIIELASDQHGEEGGVEIDSDGILSEGDDNGCYVSGWIWANFSGTLYDKEGTEECQGCEARVSEDDPHYATPCGTFCDECMEKHIKECGVCHTEFADEFDEETA